MKALVRITAVPSDTGAECLSSTSVRRSRYVNTTATRPHSPGGDCVLRDAVPLCSGVRMVQHYTKTETGPARFRTWRHTAGGAGGATVSGMLDELGECQHEPQATIDAIGCHMTGDGSCGGDRHREDEETEARTRPRSRASKDDIAAPTD
jgi:hypothetical protein